MHPRHEAGGDEDADELLILCWTRPFVFSIFIDEGLAIAFGKNEA